MANQQWSPAIYKEAIVTFQENSYREVERVQRNLTGLSPDDQASLIWKPQDQIQKMNEAVKANLALLDKVAELIGTTQNVPPRPGEVEQMQMYAGCLPQVGSKTVQSLLQSFVREWSAEGLQERHECFERVLGVLDRTLRPQLEQAAASGAPPPRVFCPGSQLGRLPFEVQRRGYSCEGSEVRPLWYFGGEFVRRHCAQRETHPIQPFVTNTCNRVKQGDHIRATPIPDVDIEDGMFPPIHFGEFIQLYDSASQKARFDGLITAFALDTSSNILRYVRTVAHVLKPGGIWANFGPLAYDTDHDEGHGHSMELSWEELRYAVSHFFEIKEEDFADSLYAANAESMMQIQYTCIYFAAIRNNNPAMGIGEK